MKRLSWKHVRPAKPIKAPALAPMPPPESDAPASADPALDEECRRIRGRYRVWMTANDVALEETCSTRTAQRRITSGDYGAYDIQPGGGLRVLTENYITALRKRTKIVRLIA